MAGERLSTERIVEAMTFVNFVADKIDEKVIGGERGRRVQDEQRPIGAELAVAELRGMVRFAKLLLNSQGSVLTEVTNVVEGRGILNEAREALGANEPGLLHEWAVRDLPRSAVVHTTGQGEEQTEDVGLPTPGVLRLENVKIDERVFD